MHRLVVHVKRWSCFVVKLRNSLLLTCGRPTARILIQLITAFGMSIPRNVADPRQRLMSVCRRSNWPAVKETRCLSSCIHESFQTVALTLLFARLIIALNTLSRWHFWRCHTVANCWSYIRLSNFTRWCSYSCKAKWTKLLKFAARFLGMSHAKSYTEIGRCVSYSKKGEVFFSHSV